MSDLDIRWIQRLSQYQKALSRLEEAVELASKRNLSRLEKEGVIQRFEYTYELAWKAIVDFYNSIGSENPQGSRDAFRLAFQRGLITKGEELLESIESRNKTTHAYNEETAEKIFNDIINKYCDALEELEEALLDQKKKRGL